MDVYDRALVARLHREIQQVMQDAEVRKRFAADGADPTYSKTPDDFAALIRSEVVKWAKVVKNARIEPQ